MEDTAQVPKGTVFTLIVPLDRERSKNATFYIKDLTEDVYNAARSMFDAKKDFDAVRLIIKALQTGGDKVEDLKDNFTAMQSLARLVHEMVAPVEGELKKN